MAPPSDKVNNPTTNEARPLHSIAHIIRAAAPIFIIFDVPVLVSFVFIKCSIRGCATW